MVPALFVSASCSLLMAGLLSVEQYASFSSVTESTVESLNIITVTLDMGQYLSEQLGAVDACLMVIMQVYSSK